MALAWTHGAGGNPEAPPDRHRGCGLHTLSSAGSPPGDAACGRRDSKSHAGLQGTAWVPGQILMLHVSSNLACPFISKSQPPNDAVSGNWFPLTCPPQYRDVDMCIHSFSWECSHSSWHYFQTICWASGLLRGCCSSCLRPFILEWINFCLLFSPILIGK